MLNTVEHEQESSASLIARFQRHIYAYNFAKDAALKRYYMLSARGLHKLLAERAVNGDEGAGNAALGAPHWLTYSDEQVRRSA